MDTPFTINTFSSMFSDKLGGENRGKKIKIKGKRKKMKNDKIIIIIIIKILKITII